MRELKFKYVLELDGREYLSRIYEVGDSGLPFHDEVIENMEGGCTCDLNESNSYCEGDCCEWENATVVGIVQYTGLKDTCESDIVTFLPVDGTTKVKQTGVVKYDDNRACFMVDSVGWYMPLHKCVRIKVIGNIHQNKELLNG